jgi:hypothetical protein
MNFLEIMSLEEAKMVAPQPRFVSQEVEKRHRQGQQRLAIAEADEQAMAQWWRNHHKDVEYECQLWAAKKAERRMAKRRRRATIL